MIFYHMTMEQYLEYPAINSSWLKYMLFSPADFAAYPTMVRHETAQTKLGTAIHCALLPSEKEDFFKRYAIPHQDFGNKAKKPGKTLWEEFKQANEGKILLSWEEGLIIQNIQKIADKHLGLQHLFSEIGGKSEVTAINSITGQFCPYGIEYPGYDLMKARADWLGNDGWIWDIKTTSHGLSDHDLLKTVLSNGYHFQAAHHRETFSKVEKINGFGWIFVSTNYPASHIVIRRCPYNLEIKGAQEHSHAVTRLAQCIANDSWPGYDENIEDLFFA